MLDELRPIQIILPTIGSCGDVQPYVALATALRAAGHNATEATHPRMKSLLSAYQVPFAPIGPDIDIGEEAALMRDQAPHWIVGLVLVMRLSWAALEAVHDELLSLCRETNGVTVSHSAAGKNEADIPGKPQINVTLFPQANPARDPSESFARRAVGLVAGWGLSLIMTRPLDRIRQRLGLAGMGPEGIALGLLVLVPVNPLVVEPDTHWETRHRTTGYWFAEPPQAWKPPTDLAAFLAGGEPPEFAESVVHRQRCSSTRPHSRESAIRLQLGKRCGILGARRPRLGSR